MSREPGYEVAEPGLCFPSVMTEENLWGRLSRIRTHQGSQILVLAKLRCGDHSQLTKAVDQSGQLTRNGKLAGIYFHRSTSLLRVNDRREDWLPLPSLPECRLTQCLAFFCVVSVVSLFVSPCQSESRSVQKYSCSSLALCYDNPSSQPSHERDMPVSLIYIR